MNEKRAHERYALWFPVTIDAVSGQVFAVCRDASAGGIKISGSALLAVGDVVTVSFRVAEDDPEERRITGKIVRVEATDDDPRTVWPHRMAVEFLEPETRLQTLFKHASSRPPPPPADSEDEP
jgi:hypothetical protein